MNRATILASCTRFVTRARLLGTSLDTELEVTELRQPVYANRWLLGSVPLELRWVFFTTTGGNHVERVSRAEVAVAGGLG